MDVGRYLRPDERVLITIQCRISGPRHVSDEARRADGGIEGVEGEDEGPLGGISYESEAARSDVESGRRASPSRDMVEAVAGVVAGKSTHDGAAILVYSCQAPSHDLLYTIPITPDTTVSLSQAPLSPSTSHLQQSARPPIQLRLSHLSASNNVSPAGSKKEAYVDMIIPAKGSVEVDKFVKEVKRLVEVERSASSPRILAPSWLGFYPDLASRLTSSAARTPPLVRTSPEHGLQDADKGHRSGAADAAALGDKGKQAPSGQEGPVDTLADGIKEVIITAQPGNDAGGSASAQQSGPVRVERKDVPIIHGLGGVELENDQAGTGKGGEAVDRVLSLAPPLSPNADTALATPSKPEFSQSIISTTAEPTSFPHPLRHAAETHPNPHLATFSRPNFLRNRLYSRAHQWSSQKKVRVRVGTYNVNDRLPPVGTGELSRWAGGRMEKEAGEREEGEEQGGEEILAFGMQEVGRYALWRTVSGHEASFSVNVQNLEVRGDAVVDSDAEQIENRAREEAGQQKGMESVRPGWDAAQKGQSVAATLKSMASWAFADTQSLLLDGLHGYHLRGQAMLISQGASRAEEWSTAILAGLGDEGASYERIAVSQYVGVLLLVFVRKDLKDAVRDVQTAEKGIGLLGFGGNKAGVAVRFKLYDTTLCFVNSHLAAFANALDRRRTDYATLSSSLTFSGSVPASATSPVVSPSTGPAGSAVPSGYGGVRGGNGEKSGAELEMERMDEFGEGGNRTLDDCHALFWLGDLNYRVDMPDDILGAWVAERKYGQILEKDQLRQDICSGKSFVGYHEGAIGFAPTYKYIHNSTEYDTKRAPAYTDRILFRSPLSTFRVPTGPATLAQEADKLPATATLTSPHLLKPTDITCERYESHDVQWSDHRPVSGTYTTSVRIPDPEKRARVLGEIKRELGRLEQVYKPSIELERREVDFGLVPYRTTQVQTVRISNTGRVPASLTFKSIGPKGAICKPFYWVHPHTTTLQPGDGMDLQICCHVDETWARRLTAGEDMNDVLVLLVEEGSDTFIPLSATFLPTIIGIPLQTLSETSAPIRTLNLADRRSLSPRTAAGPRPSLDPYADQSGTGTHRPVKEVWRCLEYLMEHAGAEGLWKPSVGLGREVLRVVEYLDTGSEIPAPLSVSPISSSASPTLSPSKSGMSGPDAASPIQARTVSLALLHILQSLPEPIIPRDKLGACAGAVDRDEAFGCLEGMSGVDTNVLIGLMSVVKLNLSHTASVPPQPVVQADPQLVSILADTIFGPSLPTNSRDGRLRFVQLLMDG